MQKRKIPHLIIFILVVLAFFIIPVPISLEYNAWIFLGLFIAVILAVILQVMPLGAICLIAIAIVALSGISTKDSDIRLNHIRSLENIVLKDNTKENINLSLETAIIKALNNAINDKNKINFNQDTKELINELSTIYTKERSKVMNDRLISSTKIEFFNELALQNHSQEEIDKIVYENISKLKSSTGIKDALSGFSNSLIWLIVVSVMVARGVIKTGLGARIAYYFIGIFGKKTIGIVYASAITETILAPVTPSNTARAGAIIILLYKLFHKPLNQALKN